MPTVHSVHIYDEHSALIKRLCGIVSSGLKVGNAVLIVATASHRNELTTELTDAGIDVRRHAREGRFSMYDAHKLLDEFMTHGKLDPELFAMSVGKMLSDARAQARSKDKGLTVFGEMVSVLWEEGKKEAAFELEAMWNETLSDRAFHLHCAYPRWSFLDDHDGKHLAAICQAHTHVLQ